MSGLKINGSHSASILGALQPTPTLDQMSPADQKKFLENLLASLKKNNPIDESSPSSIGASSPEDDNDDGSDEDTPLEKTIRELLDKLKNGKEITSKDDAKLAALMNGNQTSQSQTSGDPSTKSTGVITPLTIH